MATIYDVARRAGVSITTVSHVLNETRYVSDKTKQRVIQAVDELNYRPSSLARAMVRQETRTIALIVPDNVNPFFAEMGRGIENYGFEAGYNVILCNSDNSVDKEHAYLDMLISKRIDGVIYINTGTGTDRLHLLIENRLPTVTFDREYDGFDAILLDNFQAGFDATRHLIELGHRRIGCISGPGIQDRSTQRVEGYRRALREAGIEFGSELVVRGNWSYESGWEGARDLLQSPSPPSALFACNDMMAIGAMAFSTSEARLRVPDDLSIVGFDNITLSAYTSPPLTTISTPIVEVGERMCQMLLNRIEGGVSLGAQRVVIKSKLVVRHSTSYPPTGS